ncbi:MAG: hypothetical protein COT74_13300 [Bdellovibrionales bacterium CG10_big_fil_rev_8_21_14_0_10_45_34]|nr:MAG: hypothetical protein COT74_13300 [Bdellovibrionales bacterium CG10_big_fil_rev_8_21_14_0_10_45_34]
MLLSHPIAQGSSEAILAVKNGKIVEANRGAVSLFSQVRSNIIGTDFMGLFESSVSEETLLVNSSEQRVRVGKVLTAAGETLVEIRSVPVKVLDHLDEIVYLKDITQIKALEGEILLKEHLASMGMLSSHLAHEIGTPMMIIRGRATLAIEREDIGGIRGDLEIIVRQIDRITKLINSFLQFSHIAVKGETQPVCLDEVIKNVRDLVELEAKAKGIAIEVSCESSARVIAEKDALGQVLTNTIINSIQAFDDMNLSEMVENIVGKDIIAGKEAATPSDQNPPPESLITIRIQNGSGANLSTNSFPIAFPANRSSGMSKESPQDFIVISIQDNGPGIDSYLLHKIFDPFFTTRRDKCGTGLGLSIAKRFIESWNGKIQVESKKGQGTTFTIHLLKAEC